MKGSVFVMEKRKLIINVTEEMYDDLQRRANAMGMSGASMCLYWIAEKKSQLELVEKLGAQVIREYGDSVVKMVK